MAKLTKVQSPRPKKMVDAKKAKDKLKKAKTIEDVTAAVLALME